MDFFTDEVTFTSGVSNMNEHLSDCGLEYFGTSVVYLTETTLRHYYRIVDDTKFTEDVIMTSGDEYEDDILNPNR